MSRYNIGEAKTGFVVGWDNPLQTFFVMSNERDVQQDWPAFSIGQRGMEIPHPESLSSILNYFGIEVPAEVMQRLAKDFDERTPPTETQMSGLQFATLLANLFDSNREEI